ncbi:hypothetical protein QR680_015960 [Steinernema hermaphroditum]|uniref:DNA helicase Pif1-like 2B domain-containing protein n=1 Tax=Steinernema hermaphroditum TaxID=289476 RepID=A0AA39HBQ6_9BILA|nr:hypothetical protein QR680_015960 [Steinernema hermaphroditum]
MQAAYQIVGAGYAAPRPPPGFGIPYGIAPRYAPVQWVPVGPAGGMRLPGQQPCISSSNVVGVAPHRFGGQPLLGGGQITQQPQLGRGQSAQQQKSSVMPIGASTSRTVAYASVQNPTSVGTCSSPASVGIGTSPALAGNMRQNPGSSAVMADEQRNERPKYGQIFLLDTEEALYHRFSHPAAQSCDDDLKRGLPHVHMLLILEEPYKLRTAEDVDSLVWAELPDPVQYPRLHEIVKKMMMHGPCGPGTRSPCMDKFKTRCAKRFPKEYSEETVLEENQIPRETEDNARVMERAEESETTLTAWFALNQRDPNARQYLYGDIPRHYTWNKKDKKWQPRQAHFNVIGHENGRENEVIYGTYSEAAKALGLLRDDDEWERCLRDAIIDQMPFQLRSLFVIILCECGPGDPADLYEKFKRELSEDWIFRTNNDDLGIQIAYADLERRLNLLGKSLAQFGMSAPEQTFEQLTEVEEEIIEIPKEFVANGNLVSEIFGDAIAEGDWEEVGKRAILAPKNERCYRINQKVLDLMPGEEVKYKSIDAVHEDESSDTSLYNPVMFPTEFLNSVTHSSLPPHELKLKKNCTVMLLRNLNINEGIDLVEEVFGHGQLYVAFSRATSKQGIRVGVSAEKAAQQVIYLRNVVYKEVLQ